ncbi:MAG: citryl-CoA lyase [Pseudonocardia sp.]|uniref:HpcH/HpaI aldolase/citrate lyase family protein n=1 Tax=Pseudonocardia sp. TaxID=60912 RepID=UPI002633503A|nr:CoA ester lyase [Pseudonocardia sp.]MCU1630838.1 citryl-CoA lyase [Pseudonocardia sp.]MDT7703060.1 citrate lyase subunit beta / citryl-CoA lyase [Pseudonocardiales bacterium]
MTGFAPRSLLFVPATRLDMLAKVARMCPDAVVADLEDAVAPGEKDEARRAVLAALAAERPGAGTVLVRINGAGTPWHADDLAAAAGAAVDGVVLPKYEHPDQLRAVRSALPAGARVVVGLESVRGVADSRALLAEGPDAAYFGAEDYIADIGGRRTPGSTEVLYARSEVCLAAHLAGAPALDQAVVAVRDAEHFRFDAGVGRDLGYRGKICLHPTQVAVAHDVFTPSADEVAHARDVLRAAEAGVGVVDGQMVDAAHIAMARTVLARIGSEEDSCGSG